MLPGTSSGMRENLDRSEVIRRLRDRLQPILTYGETEEEARHRLAKLEEDEHETASGSNVEAK